MVIYKITFYRLKITPEEWRIFLKALLSAVSSFRFVILRYGKQVDFYILSKKKIDILNNRTYPFYLLDDVKDEEKKFLMDESFEKGWIPLFVRGSFLKTIEKKTLHGKEIERISFSINKFNPFRFFPLLWISFRKNNNVRRKTFGVSFKHVNFFLSFDLSNTISAEITKVKPQLVANDLKFDLFEKGILEIKNLTDYGFGRFSIKSYDFQRHSLVVGQSGSGKSMFLKLLIEDLYKKTGHQSCVVLIDPHAFLPEQLRSINESKNIDFKKLSTNLFINVGQSALSTELTLDLFSTILNIKENQTLHRVLKYTLNLLYSINKMSIENLKKTLTDTLFRKEMLKLIEDANILNFFETEYREIYTSKYALGILPILNLTAELDFINNAKETTDLVQELNNNFLVSFPVRQTALGKTITKIIGGALIQQIFTIAQAGLVNKNIILIIDEVSVVQTPSLIHILSEARKFGMTVVLSQQYLMQVPLEILHSIFANTVNYFCFKVSRDDAEILARNLNLQIDDFFMFNKNDPREILELSTKILTDLNPREVVARVLANNHFCSPFKAKTVEIKFFNNLQ